jgi:hypothetical protein
MSAERLAEAMVRQTDAEAKAGTDADLAAEPDHAAMEIPTKRKPV